MENLLSLLKKRRSTRKFKNKVIEQAKIDQLIKAALLSPSSRKINPWAFIVINKKNTLEKLSKAKEHGSALIKDAPLAIAVLADQIKSDVWVEDTSIASIIIQLAAEDLDLGSCWVQIRNRAHQNDITSEKYVQSILNIPEHIKIESIIAIGYKDEEHPPYTDEELQYNKIFINSYNK